MNWNKQQWIEYTIWIKLIDNKHDYLLMSGDVRVPQCATKHLLGAFAGYKLACIFYITVYSNTFSWEVRLISHAYLRKQKSGMCVRCISMKVFFFLRLNEINTYIILIVSVSNRVSNRIGTGKTKTISKWLHLLQKRY